MVFLEVALADLIRKRKTGTGQFVYVYVPSNTSYTGNKDVFDELKADIETYNKFVASHKPEGQPAEDFDKTIISAITGVSYEAGATEEEETGKKAAKDQFAGPLSPGKLRRGFHLTTASVKPEDREKFLAFVKALPGIIEAEFLHNHRKSWTTIAIEFDDAEKVKELTPEMVQNDYAKLNFQDLSSNLQHLMTRPFWLMGRLLRNRLGFIRFYLKAFQDVKDNTIDREAVIFTKVDGTNLPSRSQEYCGEALTKWKKAMADWEIKDVENVKVLMSKFHVYYIIVRFKTKEAAESFVAQSTNLRMDDLQVLSDMVSRIPEILSLEQPTDAGVLNRFLTGVEDEAVLEEDKTLVVCLFDEGVKDLTTIKQFFSNEKPEKMVDLSFKQSSLLGPHLFHPKLLVTFKTKEELDQTLLKLDTVNNNRTFNEWVFVAPLKIWIDQKKTYMKTTECTQTSEKCRNMFDINGDIMQLKFQKKEKAEKKTKVKEEISVVKKAVNQTSNQTNGSARASEEKLILSLGMFGEKLTNQKLFVKLKEEIGLERSDIKHGDWRKISEGGENKWKAEVIMGCDAEKLSQYILSWNKKEVDVAGKLIQAELIQVAGRTGKKRKNTDNKSNGDSKKPKESMIENY